jgi:hypothetical protein
MSEERKITIDERDYNFEDLNPEQKILVDHIDSCRRDKAQYAFSLDRVSVAEGAFAKMLTESLKKENDENDKKAFKGSPKDA